MKIPYGLLLSVPVTGAMLFGLGGCMSKQISDAPQQPVQAVSAENVKPQRMPITRVEYRILTVNPDQASVMISAGIDHGVQEGMTFLILRDGQIFNTLHVDDVYPEMALGTYLNKSVPPQKDDAVYSEQLSQIKQALLKRIRSSDQKLAGGIVETKPELGMVYLDLGELDGVKEGMWFTVTKDGHFVGNVQVREVYDKISYAVATKGAFVIDSQCLARSLDTVERPVQREPQTLPGSDGGLLVESEDQTREDVAQAGSELSTHTSDSLLANKAITSSEVEVIEELRIPQFDPNQPSLSSGTLSPIENAVVEGPPTVFDAPPIDTSAMMPLENGFVPATAVDISPETLDQLLELPQGDGPEGDANSTDRLFDVELQSVTPTAEPGAGAMPNAVPAVSTEKMELAQQLIEQEMQRLREQSALQ